MDMEKKRIWIIVLTVILLIAAVIIEHGFDLPVWQLLLVYLIPYLLIGGEVLKEAGEGLLKGEALDENVLMSVATLGAMFIGFLPGAETEFLEAVAVMLLFQIGEVFEDYAEDKSRKSIAQLMDIRPDTANLMSADGTVNTVSPDAVKVDDVIVVRPGEKIPLDGVVVDGVSSLNTLALTGESLPREVKTGDEAFSGCVNISGLLKIKVTKSFGESTVSKILELVENASENKSKSETFIAKFARIYTPVVVGVACLLAFLPPLFYTNYMLAFPMWLNRALTFLVVSCPCALVISIPLTFFGGIGRASKSGILIKGGNYMEALSKIGTIVFDKTGTLTKGEFEVDAIHPDNYHETKLLHMAAHVERFSTHPIALSLKEAFKNEDDGCTVEDVEEIAGKGVKATVNGDEVHVGNPSLMEQIGAKWKPCHKSGTIVHIAVKGTYAGHIVITDRIKGDAENAIKQLKSLGIEKTVMLTGDRREVGETVAETLRLDECHTELLPSDKVTIFEKLMEANPKEKSIAFVGDGINDAPVLARADVGIAMGGLGSDAAIEAADVVLMDDKLTKIPEAIRISRKTLFLARENAVMAIAIKLIVLLLASVGMATMWLAVFADVGVTIIAILNAARTLRIKASE